MVDEVDEDERAGIHVGSDEFSFAAAGLVLEDDIELRAVRGLDNGLLEHGVVLGGRVRGAVEGGKRIGGEQGGGSTCVYV